VPVLASVAAILPAMWPDLPIPVTTTRPWQSSISRQAWTKAGLCLGIDNGETELLQFVVVHGVGLVHSGGAKV
jgi:hypothetical protein